MLSNLLDFLTGTAGKWAGKILDAVSAQPFISRTFVVGSLGNASTLDWLSNVSCDTVRAGVDGIDFEASLSSTF